MSIFAEEHEKNPILYIVPDSLVESATIRQFTRDKQPLTVAVAADENEHLYHFEIRRSKS